MKNKHFLEFLYLLVLILAIFALNYLIERSSDISLMPAVLLIIGIVMIVILFKKYDYRMSIIWKIIPMISILVYLFFTIFLYLALFNFFNWENEPWLNAFSTVAIILYIITFLPLSLYLLFKKFIRNSI